MRKNPYLLNRESSSAYTKNPSKISQDAKQAYGKNPYSASVESRQAYGKNPNAITLNTESAKANTVNPYSVELASIGINTFGGLTTGLSDRVGTYESCLGVSALKYPALSQRAGEEYLPRGFDVDDIYYWDGYAIMRSGTSVYICDFSESGFGNYMVLVSGTVTNTNKKFAAINTKIVIFPDKKYIDMTEATKTLRTLDAIAEEMDEPSFSTQNDGKIHIFFGDGSPNLSTLFEEGDFVHLTEDTQSLPFTGGSGRISRIESLSGSYNRLILESGSDILPVKVYKNISSTSLIKDEVYSMVSEGGSSYYRFTAPQNVISETGAYLVILSTPSSYEARVILADGSILLETPAKFYTASSGTIISGTRRPKDYWEMTIKREVPDLDYICVSNNRLWGVSNSVENTMYDDDGKPYIYKGRCIYTSALGDPKNFFMYEGTASDSYAVGVVTNGDFTGICEYMNNVLCWKENEMVKVGGSTPSGYYLTFYNIPGVKDGSWASLAVIQQVLFYHGLDGFYTWSGSNPVNITDGLLDCSNIRGTCAGTDGRQYMVSAYVGNYYHTYVFDTVSKTWVKHSFNGFHDFFHLGNYLFGRITSAVYKLGANRTERFTWNAVLHPIYADGSAPNFGNKRFIRLNIRGNIESDSYINIGAKMSGANSFIIVGNLTTRTSDQSPIPVGDFNAMFPIPAGRDDAIQIRLSGYGYVTVRDIQIVYAKGSDRP